MAFAHVSKPTNKKETSMQLAAHVNVIWPRSKANIEILIPVPFFFFNWSLKGCMFFSAIRRFSQ